MVQPAVFELGLSMCAWLFLSSMCFININCWLLQKGVTWEKWGFNSFHTCILHMQEVTTNIEVKDLSDLQKDYWWIVLLHFNLGSKASPSPFRLFLLLDFLLESLCSVTAELVAKRRIFKATWSCCLWSPIYTPVAQTQCSENPALRGERKRNSSEGACKGKNSYLDIDITLNSKLFSPKGLYQSFYARWGVMVLLLWAHKDFCFLWGHL